MGQATLVQPNLDFKSRIMSSGAHDLSSCYQCGTCSVVCPLATPENPFPRKEMIWVQWGLKESNLLAKQARGLQPRGGPSHLIRPQKSLLRRLLELEP